MTDQGIPPHAAPGPMTRPSIGGRSQSTAARLNGPRLSRRRALGLGLAALAHPLLSAPTLAGGRLAPPQSSAAQNNPFPLGVASGDPSPDGFVLWTRLAPEPLARDPQAPGGLSGGDILIKLEIADDPLMHRIVRRGLARAEAAFAHSVHLEVAGLKPGRPYWYRFMTNDAQSPIGCARTAPSEDQRLDNFRFGFVSCSNYEQGYFAAYRHLAAEAPDLVLFLGDYIYETVQPKDKPTVRRHGDGVPTTLTGYRNRYAQYRLDPDLQALHAAAPSLAIWDDHEVQNDYAGEWASNFEPPAQFLQQRAAAYQAFYEHMPLRPSRCLPQGGGMRIYDRYGFGDLVSFSMLDGRQYRSREACYAPPYGGGHVVTAAQCPELVDPSRSMLGEAQETWLYDGLAQSRARWNIIGQTVLMASLHDDNHSGSAAHEWTEAWDGYPAARTRLLDHIATSGVANPVILSGDNHAFWTNELKRDPGGPTIATEFVGTSITSYGPPYESVAKRLPANPQVKFFESRKRGYASVEVDADRMVTRFQAISDAADPDASVSTLASFVIEAGRKGVETA
jgi:alkaline phosphatase D